MGVARLDTRAEIVDVEVRRFLVMGGGLAPGDWTIAATGAALDFTGIAVAENTSIAPLAGLQEQMRAAEAALAEQLARRPGEVVIVDGPLQPIRPTTALIVGYVKRMQRSYLGPAEAPLLARLSQGQRTPVFAILDRRPRYSWYVRLASAPAVRSRLRGCRKAGDLAEHRARRGRVGGRSQRARPASSGFHTRIATRARRRISCRWARWSIICGTGWAIPAWIRRLLLTSLAEAIR